jgi:hypothetical protein
VQVIFRARFRDEGPPVFAPGPESLDVRLFAPDEIPWQEIAFPSVHWALNAWLSLDSSVLGQPAGNPLDDQRGMNRMPVTIREASSAPGPTQPGETQPGETQPVETQPGETRPEQMRSEQMR